MMTTNFNDYLSQGKSNNYLIAENEGKYKTGEAAKILSKKFKTKISAKEIECFSNEWHHAGIFEGYDGKLTGRKVKFFTLEQIEDITLEEILLNRKKEAEKIQENKQTVKGWYVEFRRIAVNHYGKLGWKPFVGIYEGPKSNTPKHFTELSDENFEDAKRYNDNQLIAYANHYSEIV